jgi:hypothetical protein
VKYRQPSLALSVLVLTTALTGNPAAGQELSAGKNDSIRGTVINQVTREPISRALVSSSDQRFAALTDSEGRFEFTVPSAGSKENGLDRNTFPSTFLFARKPGFLPESTVRNYFSGKDLTLALIPEALVIGKVTLPNSDAPDSIAVEIYRRQVQDGLPHWVFAGGTQSRSDGEFRFADLRAGSYKVLTRELLDRDPASFDPQGPVYGYPPVYGQNAPDFSSATTIQVSPGMTATINLSVTRKAYHRVQVPVANTGEQSALNVTVYPSEHRGPGFSLGYNNRSRAIEGLLPDGSYTIEALGMADGAKTATGLLSINVHGAPVAGPVMTLVPNASIRVDVAEEFTAAENSSSPASKGVRFPKLKGPRSYLNVILESADDYSRGGMPSLREPTGPGDEALWIQNAHPGRYWVRVISSRGYVASVRSGGIDLRHEPLVVAAGGSALPIEITMRDETASIDGTVEGIIPAASPSLNVSPENGGSLSSPVAPPPPPAHVYCVPVADSSGQFTEAWVSPDGTFSSPPLAPGAYRILAFDRPQPELEYRNPEAMQIYDAKGPVVRVAAGQKEHARLQLISSDE